MVKVSTGARKDKLMNKLCCFITGGHKYKSSDLECKFDDDEGIVRFINHCDKCGKVSEVVVPQDSVIHDLQKEFEKMAEVIGKVGEK